ncbi:MAG: sel1 repeat family protein [Nitrospinae bacterium]|nr:sel1 repeat family protein [Nitrospinota bacterium]
MLTNMVIFNLKILAITIFLLFGFVQVSFVQADDFEDAVEVVNRRDFETAYKMFVPLAEKGHAAAQLVLGMMYFKGTGVAKNIITADKWLLISEELGQEAGKKNRIFVERQMNSDQISQARQLAESWLSKR